MLRARLAEPRLAFRRIALGKPKGFGIFAGEPELADLGVESAKIVCWLRLGSHACRQESKKANDALRQACSRAITPSVRQID